MLAECVAEWIRELGYNATIAYPNAIDPDADEVIWIYVSNSVRALATFYFNGSFSCYWYDYASLEAVNAKWVVDIGDPAAFDIIRAKLESEFCTS